MAGQLSLCQGTLAGVGGFTAALLASHLGLNFLLGGLLGALLASAVAVVLALLSLRLRGLGLALMTLAAALLFDQTFFNDISITGGQQGTSLVPKWLGTTAFFNFDGHATFLLAMGTLIVAVVVVLLVRKGTVGRNLAAMRGSETAAAGLGVNLSWQRVIVFALSGAVAGIGGVLFSIQQQLVSPSQWNTGYSLVLVVLVVTTSVNTVEGAIQAGIGFYVIQQVLTTVLPARFGGNSLTIVLFAFGALTYAQHPEGVLEYQKRRWTGRFENKFFAPTVPGGSPGGDRAPVISVSGADG
jgi:branched-chain amino acid transport system permease protein